MQVGDWRVDTGLNELSRANELVHLEPKVMEVLAYLAAHPSEVVSRETLLAAVWPGIIVGDDALTQAMIKLRKALGDDPKFPRYIQTIPKRGYKLVAPVQFGPAVIPEPPIAGKTQGLNRRLRVAWAIFILILLAAGSWVLFESKHQPEIPLITSSQSGGVGVEIEPFRAMEPTPRSLCLATGLTSELLSDLSRLPALRVFTGTYSDKLPDVSYRIDGVVQQDKGRVRIHVHLLDARNGQELWSEKFDRPLQDLLELQTELSQHLMKVLPLRLSKAERDRAARRYTHSVEAYELFLHAQSALLTRGQTENEMARDYYLQAINEDPGFARAYAGLALTYAADYRHQWVSDTQEALKHAFTMAETGRQIDPNIPEIYWALGFVHAQHREYQEALNELTRAVQLNPSYADGYALMGGIETYMGRPEKTIPLMRTAQRLNPGAGYLYFLLLGRAYYFLNDFEQARINLVEALARNEADLEAHVYLAAVMAELGDAQSAAWEVDEIHTLQPDFKVKSWMQTYPLADATLQKRLADSLQRIGM